MSRRLLLSIALLVCALALTPAAGAQTPVQQNVDNRLVVALRVVPVEAQNWLPAPWQVQPVAAGPYKDANLLLVFIDGWVNLDGDGKPAAAGPGRALAVVVAAKNSKTEEAANYVVRIYAANPQVLPGPYKNSTRAAIEREQARKGSDINSELVNDAWAVRDSSGGAIEFRTRYQRGVPARSKSETKVRGGPDPDFFRIYQVDQGLDVLKSASAGIDRAQDTQLRVTMGELRKLFDGSEQIIAIAAVPWYVRQMALP